MLVLLIFPSFVFFGIQGYSGFIERRPADGGHGRRPARSRQCELDNALRERSRAGAPADAEHRRQAVRDAGDARHDARGADPRPRARSPPPTSSISRRPTSGCARLFKSDPAVRAAAQPRRQRQPRRRSPRSACRRRRSRERLRQDLSRRQVLQGVAGSAIAPAAAASAALDAMYQQREVQVRALRRQGLRSPRSTPTDAEIEAYYKDPANAAQFQAPEQATIEYVVLDLEAVKKGITVTEDDLRKYYAENEKRYTAPEERRASHILIKADKDAPQGRAREGQGQGRGAARRGAQGTRGVRRDRAQELARTRARRRRAATSTSSAAARWSSRSRTRPSR